MTSRILSRFQRAEDCPPYHRPGIMDAEVPEKSIASRTESKRQHDLFAFGSWRASCSERQPSLQGSNFSREFAYFLQPMAQTAVNTVYVNTEPSKAQRTILSDRGQPRRRPHLCARRLRTRPVTPLSWACERSFGRSGTAQRGKSMSCCWIFRCPTASDWRRSPRPTRRTRSANDRL